MNDELIKALGSACIAAVAIYFVFLIIKLVFDYMGKRSAADDARGLGTIEVVGKNADAIKQLGVGNEAIGKGLQAQAVALESLAAALDRIAKRLN